MWAYKQLRKARPDDDLTGGDSTLPLIQGDESDEVRSSIRSSLQQTPDELRLSLNGQDNRWQRFHSCFQLGHRDHEARNGFDHDEDDGESEHDEEGQKKFRRAASDNDILRSKNLSPTALTAPWRLLETVQHKIAETTYITSGGRRSGPRCTSQYALSEEEISRLRSQSRFALLPNSPFLNYWDICVFICILLTGVSEPYVWVFENQDELDNIADTGMSTIISLVFLADTALRFFRAQRQSTREGVILVTHIPTLARRYCRGLFLVDFVSALPLFLVFGTQWRKLLMIRMVRIIYAEEITERMHTITGLSYRQLGLCRFMVISCLVLHWIACVWGRLGMEECFDNVRSWLSAAALDFPFLEGRQKQDVYLVALYWSVTVWSSVGFGDVTPTTRQEFLCATLCMVVGGGVWAYVVGSVCSIATEFDKHRTLYEEKMNDLNVLARERKLPKFLFDRIHDFYKHAEEFMRMKEYHNTILRELSPALKGQVVNWMYGSVFKRVWYFDIVDDHCAQLLMEGMVPKMYAPEEWIEATVDGNRCLVFLRCGLCVRKNHLMAPGAVWGLDVILGYTEFEDIEELLDTARARSINYAFVLKLSKQALDHAAGLIPEFKARLRKAHLRMLLWRGVIAASKATKRLKDEPPGKISHWDMLGKLMGQVVHRDRLLLDAQTNVLQAPVSPFVGRRTNSHGCLSASLSVSRFSRPHSSPTLGGKSALKCSAAESPRIQDSRLAIINNSSKSMPHMVSFAAGVAGGEDEAASVAAVSSAPDKKEDLGAWKGAMEDRLDRLHEEVSGVSEDMQGVREDISNLTNLMHQLLSKLDADEKY